MIPVLEEQFSHAIHHQNSRKTPHFQHCTHVIDSSVQCAMGQETHFISTTSQKHPMCISSCHDNGKQSYPPYTHTHTSLMSSSGDMNFASIFRSTSPSWGRRRQGSPHAITDMQELVYREYIGVVAQGGIKASSSATHKY